MVQYDPFAPLLVNTDLPMRERIMNNTSGNITPSLVDSPSSIRSPLERSKREASRPLVEKDDLHPAVHPQLRRLSSSHASSHYYCTKCYMRRSSQDLPLKHKHDHSPEPESWDGFCPDIVMPTQDIPRSSVHHARRHSGLCPENLIHTDHNDGKYSEPQILVQQRSSRHHSDSYHHDCHCEDVTPIENLAERYGLVGEHTETEIGRRRSIEKEAKDRVTEIMHEELIADMEARQAR